VNEPAQPYRTRRGAIKFQPESDWSLSRLGEVESEFQNRTGKPLPVRVRGQGSIHNKWNYDHHDSADIGLNPSSDDGRVLGQILREKQFPFLAFENAIPGVATGPHYHLGRPSHRMGQGRSTPLAQSSSDPMADALKSLTAQPTTRPAEGSSKPLEVTGGISGSRSEPPKLFPNVPAAPLTRQSVTSKIVDYEQEPLKPIPFEADNTRDIERAAGLGVLARGSRAAGEIALQRGLKIPESHPDTIGKRVTLTFDHEPTPEEVSDAFLNQHGYGEIGQRFKAETGGQLANLQGAMNVAKGRNGYVVTVRPTKGVIDAVNAYASNGIEGLRSAIETQSSGRQLIARDVSKALKDQQGVGADLEAIAAGEMTSWARYGENLKNLAMYGGPNYDPEFKNSEAIAKVRHELPETTTLPGKIAGAGVGAVGAISRARTLPLGHLGFPAQVALENAQEGVRGAGNAALMTAPVVVMGPIAKATGVDQLGRVARQVTMRGLAGTAMAGTSAASGAKPEEILEAGLTGAAFPVGERGEADTRTLEQQSRTLPIGRAQRVPDFKQVIAAREAKVSPPREFYHKDWGNVVESPDQSGARSGHTKVIEKDNPETVHFPKTADLSGAGNQRMVPVKPAPPVAESEVAVKTAEVIPRRRSSDRRSAAERRLTEGVAPLTSKQIEQQRSLESELKQPLADRALQAERVKVEAELAKVQETSERLGTKEKKGQQEKEEELKRQLDEAEDFDVRMEIRQELSDLQNLAWAKNVLGGDTKWPPEMDSAAREAKREQAERVIWLLEPESAAKKELESRLKEIDVRLEKSASKRAARTSAITAEIQSIKPAERRNSERRRPADPIVEAVASLQTNRAAALREKPKAAKEKLPTVRTLSMGRESVAVTERGSEVKTRYAVVDLDDLITSHDSILNLNPKFPQELQPRERDRAASADQISRIASQLRPEFLGESPKASEGAPIVGPDGIVESGNGRVLGIRQAYESGTGRARAYRGYLNENAERFGLDSQAITDAKRPVLVRVRTTEVDRPQFVKEANEQSIASMSPVEQARGDAKALKGTLLDLFRPSESGDINTSGNINFVRAFMRDVVGPNEIGRYTTASGQISQEGVSRIRNAIFARAYGESPEGLIALEKLAESPDNNVRNITTAMLRNAPGFASLREGIDQGKRFPLDLAPDIAAAMSKMSSLRETGMLVNDYLNQGALYGEDLTPIQKRLLQVFDENKRGANTIDALLKNYLRGAEAAGSPDQMGMFGGETPSKADFVEAAILEAIDAHKNLSPDLFAASNQRIQPQLSRRGTSQEANAPNRERLTATDVNPPVPEADRAPTIFPRSPAEGEGHPVERFDSAIDRLKSAEENARQRLAERATEVQKLVDQRGSELGATTIPQDLYDYVVIGASKLAQRSLNVAQFVDVMVKEFGEAIRKHARQIFKLSQNMVTETQKEIRNERLSKEIADRLFTENVPREQQREALRIAARFRTSTDTQGKFLSGFKSRVGEMAKSYGAAGGELANRLHLGDIARGHEMEAGNKYLTKIQDVYNETKNDFERHRISEAVISALENRAEADRYLNTPAKRAVYDDTRAMLDEFRTKLTALGYETREDYFTHIRDVDILDQIISDAKDPKDVNLDDLVGAKSRFLQTRLDAKIEIKRDLPRVLFSYLKSVTKEIAYSDAVDYYYNQFPTDIPISLRKNNMERAIRIMQNSLKPDQGRGFAYRVAGRLRNEQYRNFLADNLKASAQNFTQADFAKLRWTPEARSLVGKMWRSRKTLTGPLADAIAVASKEQTPLMRFLEQFKGDEPSGSQGRFSEAFNRFDPFQRSEGRNWALSELGSIINSAVKHPEYRELKSKMGAEGAINKLLERQDVFDKAVREAATTAAETQVAANPAMRGEFYDAPLHRIISMFTAFKTRQIQILSEALRSHAGINGARAQTILRRGLTGDAQPVEVLREIEAQRTAMEKMVQRARKFREDVGIPLRSLDSMVQHLKGQEAELNSIIKRIEPLSGGRGRSALLVGKYFSKVAAISVFFNLFWNTVYSGLVGPEKDEDAEERVSTAVQKAFWDVLPSPFYGADPTKFFASPVMPNFERSASFGHITKRGLARDVISYGSSVIPFAGVIDRATNRRASGAVVDLIAPKKEKKSTIQF
jgi:hypothetical protein